MLSLKILLLFLFLSGEVNAQDSLTKSPQPWHFRAFAGVGMIVGESYRTPTVNGVFGLQKRRWFGGIGTAIDDYQRGGMLLFLSLRRELSLRKAGAIWPYVDGGVFLPWQGGREDILRPERINRGAFMETGLGWAIAARHRTKPFLSVGYSFKAYKESITQVNPCIWPPCPTYDRINEYRLHRVALRLGVSL